MKHFLAFLITVLLIFISTQPAFTQKPEKVSVSTSMIYGAYGYMFPGGDLVKRFGNNSTIGAGFLHKTKSNFLFGADFNYIFGNTLKEDSLFYNLYTTNLFIIDGNGLAAEVRMFERGFYSGAKIGKIFPVKKSDPNSGIFVILGGGYLQHKIRIDVVDNTAPQLNGDYKKGYDRFCAGWQLNEFIGYFYMGEKKLVNFFAGIELMQGWTEPYRFINFDTLKKDRQKRFDTMTGIKVGWFIPFYGRTSDGYYY